MMFKTLVILITTAISLFNVGSASRVIFPIVPNPEFNTPVMTNGFVGGLTNFDVIGNVTIQTPGCDPYSAIGMISLIPIGPCRREDQYSAAVKAGAAAVIFTDLDDPDIVGRKSRIPLSNYPLEIPAVILSEPDYRRFQNLLAGSPYLTLEITPGVSLWHQNIAFTWWFIALNAIFFLFYLFLLGLVIYKFVRKVKATGFIWNISFVYLFFQAAFCILMVVRWIDPVLSWGIYSASVDAFIDTWPATWSFAALVLMAFFWFEVINQFADTKVQAFLSKKMQVPFWILVAIIILLPAINAILLIYITILSLFIALGAISLATGIIVTCFYVIVGVKALEIIRRSERLNVDRRSRLDSLRKSRISIIVSAVIALIYPPCAFVLRYYIIYKSIIFELAALYVESVLLGLITFIQVWFMPVKMPATGFARTGTTHHPTNAENMINTATNNQIT